MNYAVLTREINYAVLTRDIPSNELRGANTRYILRGVNTPYSIKIYAVLTRDMKQVVLPYMNYKKCTRC